MKQEFSKIILYVYFIIIFFCFFSNSAHALTPIARVDVVPYQRIEYGTTFNFGVVAFSKEGIDRVEFNINGQGYTGGVKTATEMTKNTQATSIETTGHDGVWEYWVPISSNEFTSNGSIIIIPTVYGKDDDTRVLDSVTLIVEATEIGNHTTAWVDSVSGNNSTGQVNDINHSYLTIDAAVSAAQTANGGSSDGNIIYLKNGTYTLAGMTANATTEWLTITKDSVATQTGVVISSGGTSSPVGLLKLSNLTVQGAGDYIITSYDATTLWDDQVRQIGNGRWSSINNEAVPISHNDENRYSTNAYIYDSGRGFEQAALVRGAKIEHIGNDAFSNTSLIINSIVDGLDPGPSGIHGDVYQAHTTGVAPASNRILYGLMAKDIHISGIFWRYDGGSATNNALVNVLVEMREPSIPNESGLHGFIPLGLTDTGGNDHFLLWNCTFPLGQSYLFQGMTNASIIGNVFWQLIGDNTSDNYTADSFDFENSGNNTALYNHFMYVNEVTGSCTPTSADIANSQPCPHWFSQIHDSNPLISTATTGGNVVNISNPSAVNFGSPIAESVLINRIPFATVPVDIYGNPRTGNPDVGAVEFISGDTNAPSSPTGLGVI